MRYVPIVLLAYFLPTSPTLSENRNVIFNAQVQSTCTLQVTSDGTMEVSTDLQTLSSKIGGASPGTVELSTTGGVDVSVNPSVSAVVPVGDLATNWLPEYALSGAHAVALTHTASTLNAPGMSTMTVHLTGEKSGSDRFTQGTYQATVVVTCE